MCITHISCTNVLTAFLCFALFGFKYNIWLVYMLHGFLSNQLRAMCTDGVRMDDHPVIFIHWESHNWYLKFNYCKPCYFCCILILWFWNLDIFRFILISHFPSVLPGKLNFHGYLILQCHPYLQNSQKFHAYKNNMVYSKWLLKWSVCVIVNATKRLIFFKTKILYARVISTTKSCLEVYSVYSVKKRITRHSLKW